MISDGKSEQHNQCELTDPFCAIHYQFGMSSEWLSVSKAWPKHPYVYQMDFEMEWAHDHIWLTQAIPCKIIENEK